MALVSLTVADLDFLGHGPDTLSIALIDFRYFSPRLGRYLRADPPGHSGGIDVFAYPCSPTPVVDVYGLECPTSKKKRLEAERQAMEQQRRDAGLPPDPLGTLRYADDRLRDSKGNCLHEPPPWVSKVVASIGTGSSQAAP